MATVKDLLETGKYTLRSNPPTEDLVLKDAYIGDLLSAVMAKAPQDGIWATVQGHVNVIAVASLGSVHCVVITENTIPTEEMLEKANQEEIVVLSTHLTSFQVAKDFVKFGL